MRLFAMINCKISWQRWAANPMYFGMMNPFKNLEKIHLQPDYATKELDKHFHNGNVIRSIHLAYIFFCFLFIAFHPPLITKTKIKQKRQKTHTHIHFILKMPLMGTYIPYGYRFTIAVIVRILFPFTIPDA